MTMFEFDNGKHVFRYMRVRSLDGQHSDHYEVQFYGDDSDPNWCIHLTHELNHSASKSIDGLVYVSDSAQTNLSERFKSESLTEITGVAAFQHTSDYIPKLKELLNAEWGGGFKLISTILWESTLKDVVEFYEFTGIDTSKRDNLIESFFNDIQMKS